MQGFSALCPIGCNSQTAKYKKHTCQQLAYNTNYLLGTLNIGWSWRDLVGTIG